jgi:hypothetical protein
MKLLVVAPKLVITQSRVNPAIKARLLTRAVIAL